MSRFAPSPDPQLEEITDVLLSYARLDFTAVPKIRGDGPLDAVAVGLQMLGSELRSAIAAGRNTEIGDPTQSEIVEKLGHELQTPLTSIITGMERMLEDGPSRDRMEHVLREANRLKALVDEMLEPSKG